MYNGMIHVYKMPAKPADGYCFGGGKPITFINVDWFNTPPADMTRKDLENFLRQKLYVERAADHETFLVVCTDRSDCTFTFSKGHKNE
jgi:hypothetical protein